MNNGNPAAAADGAPAGAAGKPDYSAVVSVMNSVLDDAVCPESIHNALVDLEENPAAFARHHQELIDEWRPSTPTQRKLVLRLAYLMWRQQRAERAQDGVARCRIEREAAARAQRLLDASSLPWQMFVGEAADEGGLRQSPPSQSKFEELLQLLQFLVDKLDGGDFCDSWEPSLQQIYGNKPTQRSLAIHRMGAPVGAVFRDVGRHGRSQRGGRQRRGG